MLAPLVLAAHLVQGTQLAPVDVQQPDAPVTWVFEWRAPPSCPTRDEVVAEIRSYVAEAEAPAQAAARAKLRVEVEVTPVPRAEAWRAELRLSGGDGNSTRSFDAPDCASLARAVALVSAVTLDPVLVAGTLEREAAKLAAPTTEPEPEPEPPPATTEAANTTAPDLLPSSLGESASVRAEPPEPTRALGVVIGLGGGGGYGPLNRGSASLGAEIGVEGPRWRALVVGGWLPPITARLPDERGGRLSGWWMGARGCFVARIERAELGFPTCAGIEAGQLLARGVAPTTNIQSGIQPWVATQLGQGLRWRLRGPLALSLDASLLVPLIRARFLIGDTVLASVSPAGFRALVGFELRV